jgi:hypothetical protein
VIDADSWVFGVLLINICIMLFGLLVGPFTRPQEMGFWFIGVLWAALLFTLLGIAISEEI